MKKRFSAMGKSTGKEIGRDENKKQSSERKA
jgi:hypothetical protein